MVLDRRPCLCAVLNLVMLRPVLCRWSFIESKEFGASRQTLHTEDFATVHTLVPMKRATLLVITLLLPAFGYAATAVRGEAPLVGDKDLDKSRKEASYPIDSKIRNAVGGYGCVKVGTERLAPDCTQNRAGYWFCTGVTNAWCEVSKEAEDLAKKKVTEEKAALAKRLKETEEKDADRVRAEKAELIKRFKETEQKDKDRVQAEKADLGKRFKETEQKDKDRKVALAKRFKEAEQKESGQNGQFNALQQLEASSVRKKLDDGPFTRIENLASRPTGEQQKPGSESIGDTFQRLNNAGKSASTQPNVRVTGAFAAFDARNALEQGPRSAPDMSASLESADRRWQVAEKARVELEIKQAALARQRDDAVQHCARAKKLQDACEQTCDREPEERLCTRREMDTDSRSSRSDNDDEPSGRTGERRMSIIIPTFKCVASEPNPLYATWEKCKNYGKSAACYGYGQRIDAIETCVSERLR